MYLTLYLFFVASKYAAFSSASFVIASNRPYVCLLTLAIGEKLGHSGIENDERAE